MYFYTFVLILLSCKERELYVNIITFLLPFIFDGK